MQKLNPTTLPSTAVVTSTKQSFNKKTNTKLTVIHKPTTMLYLSIDIGTTCAKKGTNTQKLAMFSILKFDNYYKLNYLLSEMKIPIFENRSHKVLAFLCIPRAFDLITNRLIGFIFGGVGSSSYLVLI